MGSSNGDEVLPKEWFGVAIRLDECERSAGRRWVTCALLRRDPPLCLFQEPLAFKFSKLCEAPALVDRVLAAAAQVLAADELDLLARAIALRRDGAPLIEVWPQCRALPRDQVVRLLHAVHGARAAGPTGPALGPAEPPLAPTRAELALAAVLAQAMALCVARAAEPRSCCVCLEPLVDRGIAVAPCGHADYCAECLAQLDACALCRSQIVDTLKLF